MSEILLTWKNQRELKLIARERHLEFHAMEILEPLLRSKMEKLLTRFMKSQYSKLTRAVPSTKKTASHIARILLNHLMIPNDIPLYVVSNNGAQFKIIIIAFICPFLRSKMLNTTAYHVQPRGQTERINKNVVTRMRYVNIHEKNRDDYGQSFKH